MANKLTPTQAATIKQRISSEPVFRANLTERIRYKGEIWFEKRQYHVFEYNVNCKKLFRVDVDSGIIYEYYGRLISADKLML